MHVRKLNNFLNGAKLEAVILKCVRSYRFVAPHCISHLNSFTYSLFINSRFECLVLIPMSYYTDWDTLFNHPKAGPTMTLVLRRATPLQAHTAKTCTERPYTVSCSANICDMPLGARLAVKLLVLHRRKPRAFRLTL